MCTDEVNLQSSHFKIFTIHYDVVETKQNREPVLYHGIIGRSGVIWIIRTIPWALGRLQHHRNNVSQHFNSHETRLLEFATFREVRDTNREVCKGSVSDNIWEMIPIQSHHQLEGRIDDILWHDALVISPTITGCHFIPVNTFDAAENTPNIVRHPERMFWTLDWIIWCRQVST